MKAETLNPKIVLTLGDIFVPDSGFHSSIVVIGMSLFIALCAQISNPLALVMIPLTGTTLGVLCTGALLGPKRGTLAVALYLLEGSCGLPVFASGATGFLYLLGPTGGYLIGFLPAAWLAGYLAQRGWDRNLLSAMVMMTICSAVILGFGLLGLTRFVALPRLLAVGLYPFIAGDLIKACLAAALLPAGWKLLGSRTLSN